MNIISAGVCYECGETLLAQPQRHSRKGTSDGISFEVIGEIYTMRAFIHVPSCQEDNKQLLIRL